MMRTYTSYTNKKNCPYVPRVHGPDISLMTEIVLDNDAKDMFPPASLTNLKKKKSQGIFSK